MSRYSEEFTMGLEDGLKLNPKSNPHIAWTLEWYAYESGYTLGKADASTERKSRETQNGQNSVTISPQS